MNIRCIFQPVLIALLLLVPGHASQAKPTSKGGGSVDQFIVQFVPGSRAHGNNGTRQRLLDVAGRTQALKVTQLRRLGVGADVIRTSRKLSFQAAEAFMNRLRRDPNVKYVEIDRRMKASLVPNDSLYAGNQWHYFETTGGINLPAAWDKATGSGVVVAVLDTGITDHSDLNANVVAGYDFISDIATANDGNARDADPSDPGDWVAAAECAPEDPLSNSSWHGTHVAGTIAAVTNNAKGVAGVAFNAKVMPLRVLGKCGGITSDIADAIVWAAGGVVSGVANNPNPAEVINMSLGGPGACALATQAAIDFAVAAGTVVVVSAGNENSDAAGYAPASCLNVITVGATGREGGKSSYSNFGSTVDVSAPGGSGSNSVASTLNSGTTTPATENYAGYQGTSMAAPHVAGTVALMQSAFANAPAAVESVLKGTAHALAIPCPQGCGAGIIDASVAISAASTGVLFIDDQTSSEGDAGSKLLTFTVRLSKVMPTPVFFNIATADGTATAGTDYIAVNLPGQSIAAGATSKTFSVTVNGDTTVEPSEVFYINVSAVVGIIGADVQGQGSLLNDDAIALSNGIAVGPLGGSAGQAFLYRFDVPAGRTSASFNTSGGTGDVDLYVKRGSLPTTSSFDCRSWASSTTESCPFPTPQSGTYYILLDAFSTFSGATLTAQYLPALTPGLGIADAAISEGNSGTSQLNFIASLDRPMDKAITFDVFTTNDTGSAGSDYVALNLAGQVIPAGSTSATIAVTIKGDAIQESSEAFNLNLVNISGAAVNDALATGVINNDDGLGSPTLTIDDVMVAEGNSDTSLATFTVSLSPASGSPVTYNIATANGTAAAAGDFLANSLNGQSIGAGQTSKTFAVTINGDATIEPNETFTVNLSSVAGASVANAQALGTIVNDDVAPQPSLSVGDVAISEGNSSTSLMTFTVSLSQAVSKAVTFDVSTANGTATAGTDYVALSLPGQNIAAGSTSKLFSVTINGDFGIEASETLLFNLGNVSGSVLADGSAVGTINNDD